MGDKETDAYAGTEHIPVTAALVPENERLSFLPRHLGARRLLGEAHVYACLEFLCGEFHAGEWDFHALSNGGFYMAPQTGQGLRLVSSRDDSDGSISADSAGIIATIMALNRLAQETGEERFRRLERLLRDYAACLPDAARIARAADRPEPDG